MTMLTGCHLLCRLLGHDSRAVLCHTASSWRRCHWVRHGRLGLTRPSNSTSGWHCDPRALRGLMAPTHCLPCRQRWLRSSLSSPSLPLNRTSFVPCAHSSRPLHTPCKDCLCPRSSSSRTLGTPHSTHTRHSGNLSQIKSCSALVEDDMALHCEKRVGWRRGFLSQQLAGARQ